MLTVLLLPGAELFLIAEGFGLFNDLLPFLSILDASCPIFYLHLANDQPRGLVVRASGYKSRGPGFDSQLYNRDFPYGGEDPRGDHGLGS